MLFHCKFILLHITTSFCNLSNTTRSSSRSPIIPTRTQSVLKMMKPVHVSHDNLSPSHERDIFSRVMAVPTNPKILPYMNSGPRVRTNEPKRDSELLTMSAQQLLLNIVFHLMHRALIRNIPSLLDPLHQFLEIRVNPIRLRVARAPRIKRVHLIPQIHRAKTRSLLNPLLLHQLSHFTHFLPHGRDCVYVCKQDHGAVHVDPRLDRHFLNKVPGLVYPSRPAQQVNHGPIMVHRRLKPVLFLHEIEISAALVHEARVTASRDHAQKSDIFQSFPAEAVRAIAVDHGIPRGDMSLIHRVEKLFRHAYGPALCVHVDKGSHHEHVRTQTRPYTEPVNPFRVLQHRELGHGVASRAAALLHFAVELHSLDCSPRIIAFHETSVFVFNLRNNSAAISHRLHLQYIEIREFITETSESSPG
ncbi:F-box and associated interaction domains-containing protein [Striga asiatica]|uniref:F-box and associated interaction domains-containing protein n=1 Tax=Striga asiatica TaxID=4170 RepID=A0A5A7QFM3_STRAF|nr:F-box and associated interaction domains-containing protein [Striga asiatica]